GRVGQVTHDLPADGWVGIEQPVDDRHETSMKVQPPRGTREGWKTVGKRKEAGRGHSPASCGSHTRPQGPGAIPVRIIRSGWLPSPVLSSDVAATHRHQA